MDLSSQDRARDEPRVSGIPWIYMLQMEYAYPGEYVNKDKEEKVLLDPISKERKSVSYHCSKARSLFFISGSEANPPGPIEEVTL